MSDPKTDPVPDEDLLEFLGGIDELNDEAKGEGEGEDFSDFLANADIDPLADAARKPQPPDKEKAHE
ncbi:MAG TPA: hypothetical protein VFP37_01780 [Steroidobacteraceae bacterium]|nr:hypothetical protein [Steroidobacteraceae bacterium]